MPADPRETEQAIRAALQHEGPVFVRVSRMPVPMVYDENYEFRMGKSRRLAEGTDVTLVANGTMVARAVEAAELLHGEGVACRVVSMPTVKPLDVDEIEAAAEETGAILTAEEHSVRGGLGGAIAEVVVSARPVPMRIMGFPGFLPTGSASWLLEHFGLTATGISTAASNLLRRKQ